MKKNVLVVATTSYAGMGPYVSEIVNEFETEDNIYFLFRDYEDDFFFTNIKKELHSKSTFVKIPCTHWNTLVDLITNKNRLWDSIDKICVDRNIKLVHYINCPVDTLTYKRLQKLGISVISTIHDLRPHEAKKEWYKIIRHKVGSKRLEKYIEKGNFYITNSKSQEAILKQLYPKKSIFYHSFPSLVTDVVKNGKDCPFELQKNAKPYILFFGRIEEYKGLSLLYDVFKNTSEICENYSLVIAGKGTNNYIQGGQNINFLNRYIKDTEIAYLYKNAKVVVYPYISATQSGVLTLAFYFGTPIIASDVPFFREQIENGKNGLLFKCGNVNELRNQLLEILRMDTSNMSSNEKKYYNMNYAKGALRKELLAIYNKII